MNPSARSSIALLAGLLTALPIAVSGHHSMAEFDRSVVTEFEGEVVNVSWRNPHILLDIETTDANGETVVWNLEGSAVSAQRRRGVLDRPISLGDTVRVAGWPSIRRARHMLVNHVLMTDGVELLIGSAREPRWSEAAIGTESTLFNPEGGAVASDREFFRVWSPVTRAWFFQNRANYQLTPEAAADQAAWDEIDDNPLAACVAPGMPPQVGNPYPMEFVQGDGYVELRSEEFDVVRTIHIEDAVDPATIEPSPLGYSVGRWEGETLVVRTTRINWPYFNRIGAPQTENVVVDERYSLSDDGSRLNLVMTVTDAATLVEPFVWEAYWIWRPGEEVETYDCVVER